MTLEELKQQKLDYNNPKHIETIKVAFLIKKLERKKNKDDNRNKGIDIEIKILEKRIDYLLEEK